MEEYDKIISTSSTGEIKAIDSATFDEIYSDKSDEIASCTEFAERLRLTADLAYFCMECHEESRAVGLCRDMLRFGGCSAYEHDPSSAAAGHALRAYKLLQKLTHSDDEYVWETASQALSDYRDYFTKKK